MKIIEVKRKELDFNNYVKRSALESDYTKLIDHSCVLVEDGEVRVIYKELDEEGFDSAEIIEALKAIKYDEGERTGGLKTVSRIFGYTPRNTVRADFCHTTSLAHDHPEEHSIVCGYGKKVADLYAEHNPDMYGKHTEEAKTRVKDEWRIEDTPFTSGIINKNNPLKYHFDSGNFKQVNSCMLAFKHKVRGGYLAIPEYDLALRIANNSITIFDGQSLLHGVTPIHELAEDSHRFTVVYYSLERMWKCLPVDEEIARIRNIKTKREHARAKGEQYHAKK